MTGSRSTLGARDGLGQILSHQNQFSIWCILKTPAGPVLPWQEHAVAGMLNCLFADLLTTAGLHLLSLAVIRERHRGWCTLLVDHATTAQHGNQNLSLNIYLIFKYMHIPWSVLPHSSLSPRLFLQLHVASFNFFFLISPWDFHNSHPLQNSGHPNPTLFSFTSTSFEDYFRLWPLWISLPRAEFSLRKISSSRSS